MSIKNEHLFSFLLVLLMFKLNFISPSHPRSTTFSFPSHIQLVYFFWFSRSVVQSFCLPPLLIPTRGITILLYIGWWSKSKYIYILVTLKNQRIYKAFIHSHELNWSFICMDIYVYMYLNLLRMGRGGT